MCSIFDCVVLNGLWQFGFDESLTFVSPTGGSTIDYVVMSRELCTDGFVRALSVIAFIDSPHFPV